MKTYQTFGAMGLVAIAVLLPVAAQSGAEADHKVTTTRDLQWRAMPSLPPGAMVAVIQGEGELDQAKPFIMRAQFPANYRIPPHSHPTLEHLTVLSGTFYVGFGDKFDENKGRALRAGTVATLQPDVVHYAYTKAPTVIQVHGTGPWGLTYVNPADDPRKLQ